MLTKNEILEKLPEITVEFDAPLSNYTFTEVERPADFLAFPTDKYQLQKLIKLANETQTPFIVLGNASNLIVRNGGIRGFVILLEKMNTIRANGYVIEAQAGASLIDTTQVALTNSLTGFEFACGIPGTLGGAVFMNAGAYDGEMSFVLESVRVITPELEIKVLTKNELELGYRTSAVKERGYIVLDAVIVLKQGDKAEIKNKIDDLTKKRKEKQPLEFPSAGSTFKRPTGYYAGQLIQDAGLKGYQIGGAQVSEKHSGFLINKDHAAAEDVLSLITYIQNQVMEKFQVELNTEVLIVGEDIKKD